MPEPAEPDAKPQTTRVRFIKNTYVESLRKSFSPGYEIDLPTHKAQHLHRKRVVEYLEPPTGAAEKPEPEPAATAKPPKKAKP